jgi:hypothetical protein
MDKEIQERPQGEQAWREVLARQEASSLSVREFCVREGFKEWSLYDWKRRLRARSEKQAAASGHASAPRPQRQPPRSRSAEATPFIDLGALGSSSARFEVRLDLGGGVVLHLVRS